MHQHQGAQVHLSCHRGESATVASKNFLKDWWVEVSWGLQLEKGDGYHSEYLFQLIAGLYWCSEAPTSVWYCLLADSVNSTTLIYMILEANRLFLVLWLFCPYIFLFYFISVVLCWSKPSIFKVRLHYSFTWGGVGLFQLGHIICIFSSFFRFHRSFEVKKTKYYPCMSPSLLLLLKVQFSLIFTLSMYNIICFKALLRHGLLRCHENVTRHQKDREYDGRTTFVLRECICGLAL